MFSCGDEDTTGITMDSPALPAAPRAMPMAGRQIQTPFPKKPCLLRGEKLIAGGGEGSAGGPDEIKRRDTARARRACKSSRDPYSAGYITCTILPHNMTDQVFAPYRAASRPRKRANTINCVGAVEALIARRSELLKDLFFIAAIHLPDRWAKTGSS